MSLDSGLSAALASKKHDISQTVLSRKRKLCELYALTSSAHPIPAPSRDLHLDHHRNNPLALFLEQNDLQKGRYFRLSTLPPRNHHAPSVAKQQPQRGSKATPQPLQRQQTLETFLTKKAVETGAQSSRADEDDSEKEIPPSHPQHSVTDPHKRVEALSEHAKDHSSDGKSGTALGVSDETRERRRSPRSTPVPALHASPDRPSPRVAPEKPSHPESPPYSPGSEAVAAGPTIITDSSLSKGPDGSANVLTPSKDENDDVASSQERGDTKVESGRQAGGETRQGAQTGPPASHHDAAETLSSPSSATGHQSAASPHSEPHSPFTSPDEDTNQAAQELTPSQDPEADDGRGSPVDTQSKSKHSVSVASPSAAAELKEKQPDTPRGETERPGASTLALDVRKPKDHPKDPSPARASSTPSATRKALDSKSPNLPLEGRKLDSEAVDGMDVDKHSDRPGDRPLTSHKVPKAFSSDKNRIVKRRKIIKMSPSKPTSMRSALRDWDRPQHSKSRSNRQDYFRTQVVREVLNVAYKQDLNTLLTNCNVSLTTSDWMLHNEEEIYRILLQRTLHLQNTQRWSLKQIAPSEEPPPKLSHWDYLLQEAKWLRTDFREERKQKLSVARQLAGWCAQWVNATPEQRTELQIHVTSLGQSASLTSQTQGSLVEQPEEEIAAFAGDEDAVFDSSEALLWCGKKARISTNVLNKIPEFKSTVVLDQSAPLKKSGTSQAHPSRDSSTGRRDGGSHAVMDKVDKEVSDLPPEDTGCALFAPDNRAMRNRLNSVWIYKPPQLPIPSQGFYEHRTPSQWTWEDDQQLRQNVKEYGVNWHLISENMSPRQEFYTTSERRTPWECYERLLILDPPQHDLHARQLLKHFHFRIEKARATFEEQQSFIRNQAQQHARDVGQPLPNLMHKRFPTPTRVERKPTKRFLAMLDASRKLARKRETALSKQEKSQQAEAQTQKPAPQPSSGAAHTPQYFSRLKHEREVKDMERMREQQRVALMEQQRRQAGYQASLTNGIGQQMRNGMANGQIATSGHLAVPSHNQLRPQSQQSGGHGGMPNGIPSNVQMATGGRTQANMHSQQRLMAQMNGQVPTSQENMARLMQQAQQQQRLQQLNRGSPNMVNAAQNAAMMPSFNGSNQLAPTSDGQQSPNGTQIPQGNTASQQSQHIAQALAAASGSTQQQQILNAQNAPQALSSGHVPQYMTLQHQIQKSNPNLTAQEARLQATEQLKFYMRQNALSAASGLQNANGQQQQSGGGNGDNAAGGSQSPYLNPTQRQSPFPQNGILASNHQNAAQGRGQSPSTAQMQQSQYQAQLRQQMYNQQRQQLASGGDPSGASASPGLAHALPNNLGLGNMGVGVPNMGFTNAAAAAQHNRTPTPSGSMRPSSRSNGGSVDMSGFSAGGVSQGAGDQQQRPGSATSMAHSPQAMSAQGFGGGQG